MALTNAYLTYGDTSRKDDVVLGQIEILTATENSVTSKIGKTSAIDTVHSFLVDTLATPGSLAVAMGTDFTPKALSQPVRLTNIVEEIEKTVLVSRPQEKVQHYQGGNEFDRQVLKALKDWGNALEFDVVRSTLVSGLSGTTAKMNGIIAAISKSTNTTVHASVVFSATILDGIMSDNWTNSNGDVASEVYVGGVLRRVIDGFTTKTNMVVNNPNGPAYITKTVSSYDTSFGTVNINKHRYVTQAGDLNTRVLGINPEKIKIAYLDMPYRISLPASGAYSKESVYGSATIEVRNQDCNFLAGGFQNVA